ncbi:metal-sulfur cluster assembly factor [Pseudorhizobium endolithicum]|uniref:Metal-sulfur cluster assembly factor n=1 Tax=Pseudorhizobium endolithicum TaxID=1191678 RepID=A0ABM8PTR7_9HYPH|nr:metal-sulfur cluster assembly factor [Pseudorhizobium endolithicum]CAD6430802.1 metal-sulfur cluster assembly factor [Rhizobium sp. Q54]CAD7048050.1 metal-sulfur cluster assembly factor [Pseudorhizobium endolithicum]
MDDEPTELVQRIRDALADVIDPELGRDVVGLGLIYAIEADEEDTVRITMTTTTAGCPAVGFLVDAVRFAATEVQGVRSVEVRLTYEPRWRPEMMTA